MKRRLRRALSFIALLPLLVLAAVIGVAGLVLMQLIDWATPPKRCKR